MKIYIYIIDTLVYIARLIKIKLIVIMFLYLYLYSIEQNRDVIRILREL